MKKAVVLVVVLGTLLILVSLALVAAHVMTQHARSAEHKIRRMKLFYAAQAGMVYAHDELRRGNNPNGTTLTIGAGFADYPTAGLQVDITVATGLGPGGTDRVTVTSTY